MSMTVAQQQMKSLFESQRIQAEIYRIPYMPPLVHDYPDYQTAEERTAAVARGRMACCCCGKGLIIGMINLMGLGLLIVGAIKGVSDPKYLPMAYVGVTLCAMNVCMIVVLIFKS